MKQQSQELLRQHLQQLAGDPKFQSFMENMRDSRDACIQDLCNDEIVYSERLTMTVIGELRTYQKILDDFDQIRQTTANSV